MNTILGNSETLELLFAVHGHITFFTQFKLFPASYHQHNIYFINLGNKHPNSLYTVTDCVFGLHKFHQSSVHFVNPNFMTISDPIHITIQFIQQFPTQTPKTVRAVSRTVQMISKKIPHFGPKFWDRSNGRSRPQTNRNIIKHLNKV